MEDSPNVVIVPTQESAEDIIEDYCDMIQYNLDHGIPLGEVLGYFFDDVYRWSSKQFLIDQAKACLQGLEDIHLYETDDELLIDEED
ncbi:hypothetical protein [Bacillus sp. UMB0728]|uniref:hypothetical protein n=1 Tax=Bacillus sp. UMB0728 TaxID=2066052 RepID=UPI000C78419C|nr:hypothetical protein [Bacillus sp. UMB0728]PLR72305.1 hypothetical protein CYJ37_12165 [Bacillus sp. UMB0728]